MDAQRKEKFRLYRGLIQILKGYGIDRSSISMHTDLVKDFSFRSFELASLSIDIEDKMRLSIDLAGCASTRIDTIVDRLHLSQNREKQPTTRPLPRMREQSTST